MNSRHMRPAPTRAPVAPMYRGPQAAAIAASSVPATYTHSPNAALLIDFDNVTMGIRSDLQSELKNLLQSDIIKGKVQLQRAYADWRRYPQYVVPLAESSIDMIMAPAYGSSKKNATDIRLAIDALELVFTRPEIGTFILLSGDSDFSTLVIKLKEYGKYVIGVGIRESSSDLLVMNCDEYYSYNALAGLVNTKDEETTKRDPWELVVDAIARMKRNGDVMRSDRLKQVMQEIDSTFDEKDLGYAKFSRFCLEAQTRGLLAVNKLENGQLEVAPVGGATASAMPATEGANADAVFHPPVESAEARPERERGRGRDRGRGRGRGRDRGEEGRPPREPRTGEHEVVQADVPIAASSDVGEVAAPDRDAGHTRSHREPHGRTAEPRADDARQAIGASGERLTRNEAFDLVRRAAEVLAGDSTPARASQLRQRAFELLGRDSESLSERNFDRILRDAHDADVIDLRRRGDDYEVTPAVAAAPLSDQLNRAAAVAQAAATAAAPATAPVPRGMGPRGLGAGARGRGRGAMAPNRAGAPSAELLSIGVVGAASPAAPTAQSAVSPAVASAPEPTKTHAAPSAPDESTPPRDASAPIGSRGRGRGAGRGAPPPGLLSVGVVSSPRPPMAVTPPASIAEPEAGKVAASDETSATETAAAPAAKRGRGRGVASPARNPRVVAAKRARSRKGGAGTPSAPAAPNESPNESPADTAESAAPAARQRARRARAKKTARGAAE